MTCSHGVSLMLPCPQCEADAKAHEERVSLEQQRAADARIVEYHQAMYGPSVEDAWAFSEDSEAERQMLEAMEPEDDSVPEDVCRGCGAPNVSHMRTPSDDYCPECRFGRGE